LLYLSTYGDPDNAACSSGTMHFFLRASRNIGVELSPIALPVTAECRVSRVLWGLREIATFSRPRGYMYTKSFLEAKWGPLLSKLPDSSILIYHYQLLPRSTINRAAQGHLHIIPYIDMTLSEMFRGQAGGILPRELQLAAIERETEGYHAALCVVSFSKSTKIELISRYKLKPEKVLVVAPGANLDDTLVEQHLSSNIMKKASVPFVVGFIGMDYRRKGLLYLIEAAGRLIQKGFDLRVDVIGPVTPEIARPWVRLIGKIDKIAEPKRFIELVAACDVGVLPSSLEGLPISLLEFRRAGVPVIGTNVNGIPDVVGNDLGSLIPSNFNVENLEAAIRDLLENNDVFECKRRAAISRRREVSWQTSASRFWSSVVTQLIESHDETVRSSNQ
jgi:glycosyltransferase involved in cell wall biosynthesis